MLGIDEVRQKLQALVTPIEDTEELSLADALDRILAMAITAPMPVPPADNAAMDGYAVRRKDLHGKCALPLAGVVLAGEPAHVDLKPGTCIAITTGAVLPRGCDTVIMQENTEQHAFNGDTRVHFHSAPRRGENIRRAGEDIAPGAPLLEPGRRLRPTDLGLLASVGLAQVRVFRAPRVALLSTGNELTEPGQTLSHGYIYDSNRHVLRAMLQRFGARITDLGIVVDRAERLADALEQAAAEHDAVIVSGGVSVGRADHTRAVLSDIGHVESHKVAIKPGKPFTFGHIGQALFLGLPGNPVSATVTLDQLAMPALCRLAGERESEATWSLTATATEPLEKKPGRLDFQRAVLQVQPDGHLTVRTTGTQGSGVLSSMSRANAFIRLERDQGAVAAGESVSVIPFDRWLM